MNLMTEINTSLNIRGLKHFKIILKNINSYSDLMNSIDHLYMFASDQGKMYMILSVVRKKFPSIHKLLTVYIKKYNQIQIDPKTGGLSKTGNILSLKDTPILSKWITQQKDEKKITVPNNIPTKNIKKNHPSCPYCGKKFSNKTSDNLNTHSCHKYKRVPRCFEWVIVAKA